MCPTSQILATLTSGVCASHLQLECATVTFRCPAMHLLFTFVGHRRPTGCGVVLSSLAFNRWRCWAMRRKSFRHGIIRAGNVVRQGEDFRVWQEHQLVRLWVSPLPRSPSVQQQFARHFLARGLGISSCLSSREDFVVSCGSGHSVARFVMSNFICARASECAGVRASGGTGVVAACCASVRAAGCVGVRAAGGAGVRVWLVGGVLWLR